MNVTRRTLRRGPTRPTGRASAFQPRRRADDAPAPAPPPKRRSRNPLRRLQPATVRIALVVALMAGVAAAAGNVLDRVEWSLFVPVALAAVTTALTARLGSPGRRTTRLTTALATILVAAWIVAEIAGGSIGDVVPGLLNGPRKLLTTEWPSPADPTVLATLAALLASATAVSVELARRTHLHLAPLAPVLVALLAVIALSAPRPPAWWLVAALGTGALVLALTRHGERPESRLATLRGELAVPFMLVAAAGCAVGAAAVITWEGRADPRDVAEADRSASLLRALEATVALRTATPVDLFVVTDESPLIGQRMPSRWRTAALDTYDGARWLPSAEVRPIGDRLGPERAPSADGPATGRYRIDLLASHTDLVPVPGPPIELHSEPEIGVQTDVDRVVVVLDETAPAGTTLRLVAEIAPTIAEVAPAAIVPRPVGDIESAFTDLAEELAGDGEALARLQRLEQEMRAWQLSEDVGGGQQLKLLELFMTERRGTAEQFTATFVLLARSLGFDARIATGFAVPPEDVTSPMTVRSLHAAAWPEVNIAGAGWVAFDPVPEAPVGDVEPEPPPPEQQTPTAAQPPVNPPAQPGEEDVEVDDDTALNNQRWGSLTSWIMRVSIAIAAIAVPAALTLTTIVAIKLVRRSRRRRISDPSDRVRAAWATTTDALVDAGLTIEPSWTDDRIAAMGAPLVGQVPHELARLASMSTAATFGPVPPPEATDQAWDTERLLRTSIAGRMTRWQRLRWYTSLRSLRRSTRSPVTA